MPTDGTHHDSAADSDRPSHQAPAAPGPGVASAGTPSGAAPSGAVSAGSTPADPQSTDASSSDEQEARVVPGQGPGPAVPPVPPPGAGVGVSTPEVKAAQAASPEDGIHQQDKAADSDATTTSSGAWTALAPPGKPDGEVDTRAR